MKSLIVFPLARLFAVTITTLLAARPAQAANTSYQLSGTSGDWSTNSWSPATIGGIGAGDFAFYAETAATSEITLDVPVTLGGLSIGTAGTKFWTINATGGNAFTLDGTGINGSNNWFGNAGVAAIGSRGVGANLTIHPDIVLTNTDLDMGNTNSGTLTIVGNITASTAQAMNFRGGGTGVVMVNGIIGASGGNIAVSNLRGGGGNVTIATSLGSSVTSVTANSSAGNPSNLILAAANTSYAGTMTLTAGLLQGLNSGTTNVLQAFGPGGITLNGGTLQLRANGTGNTQTIITGNGTTGNNVTVGGNTTINVQRNSANTGNTFQFNNLSIGANTLSVTGANTYALQFAGTTTLTGNATINPTSANITLAAINDGGGAYGITKTGTGTLTLPNSNTYAGKTNVTGGVLQYNSAAAIAGTGRNVLVGPNGMVSAGYAIDQAFLDRLDSASSGTVGIGVSGTTSTDLDFTNLAGYLGTNTTATYTGTLTPQGTTYRLGGGGGTLTLSNANAITGAGKSLVVGGSVQSGTSIIALTHTNDIGTVTVNGNTLQLSGANGALTGVTTVNLNAGSFVVDNTGAGNNNNSRINDSAVFNFGGGALAYKGYSTAGTNSSETIGNLTLIAGPQSTFTVTFGSTNTAVVTAGTLTRAAGAGTMLVNGSGLGKNDSAVASVARLLVATPTLVGTTDGATTGIDATIKDTKIVPFLVGEATTTTGGIGSVSGTANTFVTWNASAGLRPLNPTDEFDNTWTGAVTAPTAGNNIYLSNATASTLNPSGSSVSINSLVVSAAGLAITDGKTLNVASGSVLFVNNFNIIPSTSTGNLDFGISEGIITVNSGKSATISAAVTGSSGLTKSGLGTLTLSNVANSYTGKTAVLSGTLVYSALSNAGDAGPLGAPTGTDATIDLYPGTTFLYTGSQTNQTTNRTINLAGAGSGTVTLNGNNINDTNFTFNGGFAATGTGPRTLLIKSQGDRPVYTYAGGIPDMSDASPVSVTLLWGSGSSADNGIINLQSVNTFTGPLVLTGGTHAGTVGTFLIGGSANVTGTTQTIVPGGTGVLGNGNYGGNITFTAGTAASVLLNHASSANQILSGVISGPGALTKSGIATLTLSGANTYAGTTTVSGGTLLVNGTNSGAGAVNVSAAATLGGTGSIGGNTTIAVNGRLAFTLGTVAASHDPLDISGTLVFSGASVLDITASGALPAPGLYTLVTTTGGITGSVPATVNLPPDWDADVSFSADNKNLLLNVTSTGTTISYATWATANADGQAANLDYDMDGVKNGVEYFMGATGSTFTANPGMNASHKITWPKDPNFSGTWQVQTSPDLSTWTNQSATDLGTSVEYSLPPGLSKLFVRLVVTPH